MKACRCWLLGLLVFAGAISRADDFGEPVSGEELKALYPEPVWEKRVEDVVFSGAPQVEPIQAKPVEANVVEENATEDWLRVILNPGKASAFNKRVHRALAAKEKGEAWPSDLPTLSEMAQHSNLHSRMRIASVVAVRARSKDVSKDDRRKYIEFLTEFLNDPSHNVVSTAIKRLQDWYKSDDFTETAVENVRQLFDRSKGRSVVLLMGRLDIDYAYENTKELLAHVEKADEDGLPPRPLWMTSAWAPALVAARKGEKESIRRVLAAAEERWVMDTERSWPTQKTQLIFPQLEYVRQPEVVEHFRKYLFSDKLFFDDHGGSNPYGYHRRVASCLVRMLEGFPWPSHTLRSAPKREDQDKWIAKWREWMNAQTEWVFRKD